MPPNPFADDPADQWAPFAWRWRLQGREAASVRVSGEVDIATAPQLDETLRAALAHARLVLVDLREMSFMDSTGLRVILDASVRAREQRGRLVFAGVPAHVESLLDVTGTRASLDLRATPPSDPGDRNGRTPPDNPVNDRGLTATGTP